jgi:hypothetical protein
LPKQESWKTAHKASEYGKGLPTSKKAPLIQAGLSCIHQIGEANQIGE